MVKFSHSARHPYFALSALALFASAMLAACGGTASSDTSSSASTPSPSTVGVTLGTSGSTAGVGCTLSYNAFNSSVKVNANSISNWTCSSTSRTLTANGIPDHAVTDGEFATPISAQNLSITLGLTPTVASITGTTLVKTAVGYVLNGVKLDPGTDGTCAASATSTAVGGGCVAAGGTDPWTLEAIGGAFRFGTDSSNAHVQPNGQYHYHGMPEGYLTKAGKGQTMTLVGYGMDGFPIYARYGYTVATNAGSAIKVVKSSYSAKAAANADAGRPSTSIFPMGTFTQDYQYVAGSGDLDECNGRIGVTPEFPKGIYHYYITDTYPFIQRCVKGTAATTAQPAR